MSKLFLLPIILCLVWLAFLHFTGIPFAKGKVGFIYIIVISAAVIALMTLMMWLTQL